MKMLNTLNEASVADLHDFAVHDQNDHKVGTVDGFWSDPTSGQIEFLGVKTGWLFGKNYVTPAAEAQIDETRRVIRLPYTEEKIKGAPSFATDAEIDDAHEQEIFRYYGLTGHGRGTATTGTTTTTTATRGAGSTGVAAPGAAASSFGTTGAAGTERRTATTGTAGTTGTHSGDVEVPLSEEEVKVGKRMVETGGVRLRKVVRSETVNQPVELLREDVVIERVGAGEVRPGNVQDAFNEKDLTLTTRREEAVVSKEAHVTGAVRAHKTAETERQNVSETVRREDVEVEREGGVHGTTGTHRETTTTGTNRTAAEIERERREREGR